MDGLHGEAAQLELLAGGDLHELGLACQAELFQLIADEAAGQAGAVDGQIELLQQVGDAADVVLMAVGDEQALDLILILHHKGEVGDDHIDAEHIVIREDEAAVHDDHIAAALIDRHVLAHFAEAAQRIDMDGRCSLFGLLGAAGPTGVVGAAGSAGALFAGRIGRSGSVVLFFCLCHRKPPKIQSAKHRSAPEDSLPCIKGSIKTHLLPSDASYRNHFISVVFMPRCRFRRKPFAHPVHLFDATAALRQERCERTHGAPLYAFRCNKYSISRLFCQFQAWAGRW